MGSPDLSYDSVALETLGQQLTTITSNLKNDEDLKRADIGDVAHQDVVNAIDDFVGDWDDKRKKLVNKVEALSKMATESFAKYNEADRGLADSLTSEETPA